LIEVLKTKDLSLEQLFKEVRKKVIKLTNLKQVPWENSCLLTDVYLV
jgi:hypothetical protein